MVDTGCPRAGYRYIIDIDEVATVRASGCQSAQVADSRRSKFFCGRYAFASVFAGSGATSACRFTGVFRVEASGIAGFEHR
jgi:hypothetical protein